MKISSANTIGLYLHFPFCLKRCSYCDFYSIPVSSPDLINQYVESLITEIELKAPNFQDREIRTVYLGGGTPSLLSARQFSVLMDVLVKNFRLGTDLEISLEANPATLDENKLKTYIKSGLNRISIGCQSFSDPELELLGRIHDVKQIYKTVDLINKAGLKDYNIDLIYGIPNQTVKQWLSNLEKAISLNPTHISMYLLQLDPNTALGTKVINKEVLMLEDEIEETMYSEAISYLHEQGFKQYEISNFSKLGYRCQHNLVYWQAKEYLGLGAGAVSFLGNQRCINNPQMADYINYLQQGQKPGQEVLEVMNEKQLVEDAVILGLRLTEGIDIRQFNEAYATDLLVKFKTPIEDSRAKKLLKIEDGFLKLTKKGYFLSNQVLCQFIGN